MFKKYKETIKHLEHDSLRTASKLELFFDLVYVGLIKDLSHFFLHDVTFTKFIWFILLFSGLWLNWLSMTYYHNRFGIAHIKNYTLTFINMLAILGVGRFEYAFKNQNLIAIILSLLAAKISLLILWRQAAKDNAIHKRYLHHTLVMQDVIIVLIFISLFLEFSLAALLLSLILIIDFVNPLLTLEEYKKLPLIDEEHMNERFSLLMIIIFGEGIISLLNYLVKLKTMSSSTLFFTFLILFSIFILWLSIEKFVYEKSFSLKPLFTWIWWMIQLPLMISIVLFEKIIVELFEHHSIINYAHLGIMLGIIITLVVIENKIGDIE